MIIDVIVVITLITAVIAFGGNSWKRRSKLYEFIRALAAALNLFLVTLPFSLLVLPVGVFVAGHLGLQRLANWLKMRRNELAKRSNLDLKVRP